MTMHLTDDEIAAAARAAGMRLESWMTNPPKPMQWHATPEALRKFTQAIWDEARDGVGISCGSVKRSSGGSD